MADFSMFAGDTKVLQVLVRDTAQTPVNITGTMVRWQMAKTVKDEPSLIYKAVGQGITIVGGAVGRFDVLLEPEDTLPFKGQFYYEAEIDDAGVISTVLTGFMEIKPALIEPAGETAPAGSTGMMYGGLTDVMLIAIGSVTDP